MAATRGMDVTTRIAGLQKAADELSPHRSLERIDAAARAMLGTAGLVTGLVTAIGAVAGDSIKHHPGLVVPALVCAALSLTCASWATVGTVEDVGVDDLAEVEEFYTAQIATRGWLVRASGVLLGLAVVATLLPLLCA